MRDADGNPIYASSNLQAVMAPALNVVKNHTLGDLHVRRDYTGAFRMKVQLESGERYVINIKKEW